MESLSKTFIEGVTQLLQVAQLASSDLLVVGGSTSEIMGHKVGTSSNIEIAQALLEPLFRLAKEQQINIAIQCCEHLNRAIVVEKSVAKHHNYEIVQVKPALHAGGALATMAYSLMEDPVVVEDIRHEGNAGIDIGNVLIGMHLKSVVVPVRTTVTKIGEASIVFARTRPKYIGGPRAQY